MVRGYHDYLSGLLGTQLGQLCLLAVLTNPPTRPTLYVALVIFQSVFKTSLKTSQSNQSIHIIYVSVMIPISLLYFWCKSCAATIKHKKRMPERILSTYLRSYMYICKYFRLDFAMHFVTEFK